MVNRIYTEEDGAIFTQLLWDVANQASPEFVFALLTQITDHIEVNDKGAILHFTQEFQNIEGPQND